MLCHIFYSLTNIWTPFNVFQYITFRAGGAVLTSLIISLLISSAVIKKLAKFKQVVRNDGPATHLYKKNVPTMGGIIIAISIIVSSLLWAKLNNRFILCLLFGTLWMFTLGFVDDYLKLKRQNSRGLSAKWKLAVQTVFSAIIAVYLSFFPQNLNFATLVNIPFFKEVFVNFSYLYIPFVIVIIVGSSNSVNLTDGLDGLAIGSICVAAFTFAVFAYLAGHFKIAAYLKIVHIAGAGEITIFLFAVLGAGLGFLWYNSHPAEIFMGDTGSLFLGAILGMAAVFIKQELILLVVGGVFAAEALSVLIQIYFYKKTKKRIFRMAPLHHHFEIGGLSETKVTVRFWIISVILAIISFSSLKLR
jgi:phospho-N-acetylmuramoyl-pentapeptide-transferase